MCTNWKRGKEIFNVYRVVHGGAHTIVDPAERAETAGSSELRSRRPAWTVCQDPVCKERIAYVSALGRPLNLPEQLGCLFKLKRMDPSLFSFNGACFSELLTALNQ